MQNSFSNTKGESRTRLDGSQQDLDYKASRKKSPQLYNTQPTFIARRIRSDELGDEKDDKLSPSYNELHQISEEPFELSPMVSYDKSALQADMSQILDIPSPGGKTPNIFKTEMLHSTKFQEHTKGPVIREGKVVKHSIVGPVDVFERHLRRAQRYGTTKQDSDTSFTTNNESAISISKQLRQVGTNFGSENNLSGIGNGALTGKKIVETKRKEIKREIKVPREELLAEIDEMKTRQAKFYMDMHDLSNKMRTSDMLYFTKDSRCMKNFDETQQRWGKIIEQNNSKVGRSVTDSLVVRADNYREKKEQADTFDILKNDEERYGSVFWYMTLRKNPEDKEKRGQVMTGDIPGGFHTSVVDRPMSSVEVIRKPKMLNSTMMSTWKPTATTGFASTTANKFSERSGREYYQTKLQKHKNQLSQVKAAGDGIDDLIVNGENVLNREIAAVFKNNERKDYYPVMLHRDKKDGNHEEIIAQNYDKKFLYMNGYNIVTQVNIP